VSLSASGYLDASTPYSSGGGLGAHSPHYGNMASTNELSIIMGQSNLSHHHLGLGAGATLPSSPTSAEDYFMAGVDVPHQMTPQRIKKKGRKPKNHDGTGAMPHQQPAKRKSREGNFFS